MSPDHKNKAPKLKIIQDRAKMLHTVRSFFYERKVLEVDCPALSSHASVDAHIDLIETQNAEQKGFLHSSPEYGMKRLLCEGLGDAYQLSHVFRQGEQGSLHHPEFMMIEWYRLNFSYEQMMEETAELIQLFVGEKKVQSYTYAEAFALFADVNILTADFADLKKHLDQAGIDSTCLPAGDCDEALNLIFSLIIQERLPQDRICLLSHFPASQAALAQCQTIHGQEWAMRFEAFYGGMELANGYQELACPEEHKKRFAKANQKRLEWGKISLQADPLFLEALEKGLPDCCGVAVGFDRLMLLRHGLSEIKDVLIL